MRHPKSGRKPVITAQSHGPQGKMATTKKPIASKTKKRSALVGVDGPYAQVSTANAEITILGTAHVSQQSVADVEAAVRAVKPQAICIELCQPRYDALRDPDRWRRLDLAKLIKDKKIGLLVSSLVLSAFQKKIGATAGVEPGAEMVRAADIAEQKGIPLFLSDREVRITLVRAWRRVGFFSRMWLASTLFASLLVRDEIDEQEVERLKQEDVLSDLFDNLPARYNSIKKVIIDERDQFLAEKIRQAATEAGAGKRGKIRVLAVVGAGHLSGIESALKNKESVDLSELQKLPAKSKVKDILSWSVASVLILAVSYLIGDRKPADIWNLLLFWVACRSGGAGIGAIVGGARPLTILVTVAAAPISIFLLGSRLWMFSALTELWADKPRVEDFENIARDTDSASLLFRSLYRNRVLNLFWIIFTVSMGLTLGNLIFFSEFVRTLLR